MQVVLPSANDDPAVLQDHDHAVAVELLLLRQLNIPLPHVTEMLINIVPD